MIYINEYCNYQSWIINIVQEVIFINIENAVNYNDVFPILSFDYFGSLESYADDNYADCQYMLKTIYSKYVSNIDSRNKVLEAIRYDLLLSCMDALAIINIEDFMDDNKDESLEILKENIKIKLSILRIEKEYQLSFENDNN